MGRCFVGLTDTGLVRAVNQDSYYADPDGRFFIVADGMGGHAGGQEASKLATECISAYIDQYWTDSGAVSDLLLRNAIIQANQAILEDQQVNPERAEMGTTVVLALFRDNEAWCAHVGDSRLYVLRDSKLELVTEDHTWVSWALRAGTITPEEASVHPWRHVLSQCLGRQELDNIEIQQLDIASGDRLLLCSDGLTGELSEDLICSYIETSPSCQEAAYRLVEAAKDKGGSDNITVVLVAE
ncbi:serine/threonine protein phosphatase [Rubidibacter lacunae KORDI 51-2]|uniref:Serine/threonine protein phosphatase n=1 Tax=Rubidibacter lacunae KORDI 51-2 TaxID=582515 RepID=U5DK46_9CHRO|nr:Stp1/IreP family PP2C-type Ser/Thr phosphatase [Rubidibacter lacunae]ERN40055.1 serine/threonine protein phosphatase [Rubidibacter lacunae KORDI 51-2]